MLGEEGVLREEEGCWGECKQASKQARKITGNIHNIFSLDLVETLKLPIGVPYVSIFY